MFYRHFKYADQDGVAGTYEVLHIAEATETNERMVVYRPCYKLPDLHEEGVSALVRTETNFNETEPRMGGKPRFRLVEDEATVAACAAAVLHLYGSRV